MAGRPSSEIHAAASAASYLTAKFLEGNIVLGPIRPMIAGLPSEMERRSDDVGRRFTKLDDIIYCFWQVDEHRKNYISFSPLTIFIKVQYHKNILIISCSHFADRKQMQNTYFIVGPLAKQIDLRELDDIRDPDLNSVHDCHFVSVRGGAGYDFLVHVNLFGRDSMVRFEKHDDGMVSFAVNRELLNHIHERVVQRFYHNSI